MPENSEPCVIVINGKEGAGESAPYMEPSVENKV